MKILIFDYDGVIADSLEIIMKKVISACRKYGSSVATKEDFLALFDGNLYERLIESGISKESVSLMMGDFHLEPQEQKSIKLFDGIKEALKSLSKCNKMIIVTSNLTRVIEDSLKLKDIDYFEEVIGADKETSKIKKIEDVKAKYEGEILYIGDTTGDIIEGKKAKVKTISVTWGWHDEDKLKRENPDFIVRSPSELERLIGRLNKD